MFSSTGKISIFTTEESSIASISSCLLSVTNGPWHAIGSRIGLPLMIWIFMSVDLLSRIILGNESYFYKRVWTFTSILSRMDLISSIVFPDGSSIPQSSEGVLVTEH